MKKFGLQPIVATSMLLCFGLCVQEARAATAIGVSFNDKPLQFAAAPEKVDGRVLVPLRDVFEALGATVKFDAATKGISATRGATNVKLQIGSTAADINGKASTLDVPAQTRNGHTFVPLRFVSEALGVKVSWNAKANAVEIRNRLVNATDGAEMVWVAPGEFTMGSNSGYGSSPAHKVALDGFWMYKNEVTVAQYKQFCDATKRAMADAPDWGLKDDHPVVKVSWDDATAYCAWAGTRLPTEAQWEKAARGSDARKYPWGNEWSKTRMWASTKTLRDAGGTAPVGSFPRGASPYGCLDMIGNAYEWCSDWFDEDYYKDSPARNPRGPTTGAMRSQRGGSWWYAAGDKGTNIFQAANRSRRDQDYEDDNIGFRCARDG